MLNCASFSGDFLLKKKWNKIFIIASHLTGELQVAELHLKSTSHPERHDYTLIRHKRKELRKTEDIKHETLTDALWKLGKDAVVLRLDETPLSVLAGFVSRPVEARRFGWLEWGIEVTDPFADWLRAFVSLALACCSLLCNPSALLRMPFGWVTFAGNERLWDNVGFCLREDGAALLGSVSSFTTLLFLGLVTTVRPDFYIMKTH